MQDEPNDPLSLSRRAFLRLSARLIRNRASIRMATPVGIRHGIGNWDMVVVVRKSAKGFWQLIGFKMNGGLHETVAQAKGRLIEAISA